MTSDGEVLLHGYAVKCDVDPSKIRRNPIEFNCVLQPCTSRLYLCLFVLASYDEYTALVNSGNVANKHVWRAVNGNVSLVETWIPVTY